MEEVNLENIQHKKIWSQPGQRVPTEEGSLENIQHKKIWSQPGLRAPTWILCEGGFWKSSSKPKKRPSELLFVLLQPCFAHTCNMGRPIS